MLVWFIRQMYLEDYMNRNGKPVKCERRQMLRMMSKTILIQIRSVTHTHAPYFIIEEHLGKVFAIDRSI